MVGKVLEADFDTRVLLDPTEQGVRDEIESIRQAGARNGPVIMLWGGHGYLTRTGSLRLLAKDSGSHPAGLLASEVALSLTGIGGSQILLILDVCSAGGAVLTALDAGLELSGADQPFSRAWFGLLASCQREQPAYDGLFAQHLVRILERGPADPHLRRWRWSAQNAQISGHDLADAVVKEWTDTAQTPVQASIGSSYFMLRNPRFHPGPPSAADASLDPDAPDWFTGRRADVAEIERWIASAQPGLAMVTGAAGTGKTALVEHALGCGRRAASWVSAHGLTVDRLRELLAGPPTSTSDGKLRVIVVDGLNASGPSRVPIAGMLTRAAATAMVIVTTRTVEGLRELLQPHDTVTLDHWSDQVEADLRDYVNARLAGVSARMDPIVVADHLVQVLQAAAEPPPTFRLAHHLTGQLRAAPVDTDQAGWAATLNTSVDGALFAELVCVTPPPGRALPPGVSPASLARHLLCCLSWCLGAGFPVDEWIAVANATGAILVDRRDIEWLLEQLGSFVIQDGEEGVGVYRLSDPSLVTAVRQSHDEDGESLWSRTVAAALLERYRRLIAGGLAATQPRYLWAYGWQHAAVAGPSALPALRALVELDDDLRVRLAQAERLVGERLLTAGEPTGAVSRLESAAASFTQLTGHERELAESLGNLGAAYRQVGRLADAVAVAHEALDLYRQLPDSASDLAPQLNNIAVYLKEVGELDLAATTAQSAVDAFREAGAGAELAMGLTNLGSVHRERGELGVARSVLEEAVHLYRDRIGAQPDLAPSLASALNGLAGCLTDLADVEGALHAAEEAERLQPPSSAGLVKILANVATARRSLRRYDEALTAARAGADVARRLSTTDPAYRAHLGLALRLRSQCALDAGHIGEAIASAQEAVASYRSSRHLADSSELALALSQLSRTEFAGGRLEPALAGMAEAVRLLRLDTDGHAGRRQRVLVATLRNAAVLLRRLNRVKEAIAVLREAASLSPDLVPIWLELVEEYAHTDCGGSAAVVELYDQARAWVTAVSVEAELAVLRASPRLLTPEADAAVAEALRCTDTADAAAMAARRRTATEIGVGAAYEPLIQLTRARRFALADPAQQLRELDDAADLAQVLAHCPPPGDSPSTPHPIQVSRAMALLAAANAGVDRALLTEAPPSDPASFAWGLLDRLSHAWDSGAWTAVAGLADEWAVTPADRARAQVAAAVAAAVAGDQRGATEILVRTLAMADADLWSLIGICARVARWEPTVAAVLADTATGMGAIGSHR